MILKKQLIILIGFMGTGKSTVGKIVARKSQFDFVDLDKLIEKEMGLSIPEIFDRFGEAYFRELESNAILSLKNMEKKVVSCGGGAVLIPENLSAMKEAGLVIALDADVETLWQRLKFSRNRPLLKTANPKKSMEMLYLQRQKLYDQAHKRIDTTRKSAELVAQEVYEFYVNFKNTED